MAKREELPEPMPSPPVAAADKPPSRVPGEPFRAEVSRTDSPSAGVSAGRPARTTDHAAPKPDNPTAAQTATTSEWSAAADAPGAPRDNDED